MPVARYTTLTLYRRLLRHARTYCGCDVIAVPVRQGSDRMDGLPRSSSAFARQRSPRLWLRGSAVGSKATLMNLPDRRPHLLVYRRLLKHMRPCWKAILGLLLLNVVSAPISLLGPLPLKIAIDNAIGGHPLPAWLALLLPAFVPRSSATLLAISAGLVVLIALLSQLQNLASSVLGTVTAQHLVLQFRTTLFRHVQRLSLAYHDEKGSMDAGYRIALDAPAIQYVAIDGLIPFVASVVSFVSIVYVTVRVDWELAIVALSISPVLFVISHRYRRQLRPRYRELKQIENGALSVVQEALGALRVVKAFGQEEREERRFSSRAEEGVKAQKRLSLMESGFGLLIGTTTALGMAITLLIGGSHVRSGVLTLGELLLVMAYLSQLYSPLTTMSRKVASIQSHLASIDRAFALLDEAPEVPERPGAKALERAAGAVTFRDVSFGFSSDRQILKQVSFDLTPGTRLGISGTTGAGKTTLVNLLTRFYDPTDGQILLDGVDLRDYRLDDLRAQFAIVLQEPILFSSTIRENIAYGKPSAGEAEVVAAAKAANVHGFIVGLPQGYDTLVGERGMRLSGGERQRISLARAFLKDAPILILDEPTSSVDNATEATIMDAVERLMRGRTTLMIAHRLSTLSSCDVRLELEGGRAMSLTIENTQKLERPLSQGGV
jgi:ATP-binding cassette, subfamily B, bacterial